MIRGKNIHKRFGEVEVLKGIDIEISTSEVVAITGSSGAGKTTLIQVLSSLEKTDQGQIYYDDQEISKYSSNKLADFRNLHIGFVFQFHHLLAEFTAMENVMMPALIKGDSKKVSEERAKKLLDRLGLSHRLSHKPSELSGGEQQRLSTARALMNSPKVVFADEPSGNLDSQNADQLHQLFFELREEFKQTFVIVTHDKDLAKLCDRQIALSDGKIDLKS